MNGKSASTQKRGTLSAQTLTPQWKSIPEVELLKTQRSRNSYVKGNRREVGWEACIYKEWIRPLFGHWRCDCTTPLCKTPLRKTRTRNINPHDYVKLLTQHTARQKAFWLKIPPEMLWKCVSTLFGHRRFNCKTPLRDAYLKHQPPRMCGATPTRVSTMRRIPPSRYMGLSRFANTISETG